MNNCFRLKGSGESKITGLCTLSHSLIVRAYVKLIKSWPLTTMYIYYSVHTRQTALCGGCLVLFERRYVHTHSPFHNVTFGSFCHRSPILCKIQYYLIIALISVAAATAAGTVASAVGKRTSNASHVQHDCVPGTLL